MRVSAALVKPGHGLPMVSCQQLKLVRGIGIEGDVNASAASSRQILLVSLPVLRKLDLRPGMLRENILVDAAVEQFDSGTVLRIGSALVRLTIPCAPCSKLEKLRLGLGKELHRRRGYLGRVVCSGSVEAGDQIKVIQQRCFAFANTGRERVWFLVQKIPWGKVVPYHSVVAAAGLPVSYARTIPRILSAGPVGLPKHRVVDRNGRLSSLQSETQALRLAQEGVRFLPKNQVPKSFFWNPLGFFDDENYFVKESGVANLSTAAS